MNMNNDMQTLQRRLRDIEYALNESSIVSITDENGNIQFANEKFCEISKYSLEELVGENQRIVSSGYHSKSFIKNMWQTIKSGKVWRGEMKDKAKDGTFCWLDTTIVPFLADDGHPYQYISIRYDISDRKAFEDRMQQMAYYDPLTSLPNRNYLTEWMKRRPILDAPFATLFVDLDRFKSVNDNYGHHTGDMLLVEVAGRLRYTLPDTDFISRQGGDEFIIILDHRDDKEDVIAMVERVQDRLFSPFIVEGKQLSVTASIGISMNKGIDKQNYATIIENGLQEADNAMYLAKKEGGNMFCFHTPDHNKNLERYYQIETEIKQALTNKQFSLHFQPLVDLEDNEFSGVETLLRWQHPTLGYVSPAEFIPILEKIGLIIPVGNWVLRQACAQMSEWRRAGIHLDKITVNVSPVQFRSTHFIQDVKQIVEDTGMSPQSLELEITEGTLLHIEKASRTLGLLKELGVQISIDDFGTGYSSLSYLKQLPIDTLKIDKSFIDDLDTDGKILVNTMIQLGHNLHFTVIAEGIEDATQLDYLLQQQCSVGQGYYFSKPVEAGLIESLYRNWEFHESNNRLYIKGSQ